ncbi:MAG: phosphopentomutase [Desulfuromonadales bacterium]|nr:phosphopentomutase [Desulfuromonadales bacterium]
MTNSIGRVALIVLDGVGIGALPDAAAYGDAGAATLPHVAAACGGLHLPNLERLGLGRLAGIAGVAADGDVLGAYGRLASRSAGKDSTTGHWELAGVILDQPLKTFPEGFPPELVARFAELAGTEPLGNVPANGVSILKRFGAEHVRSGRPILYTSVDSVFQIAAHEEVIPLERLYRLCAQARLMVDPYRIGRVIARPFVGSERDGFRRSPHRRDFSMPPPQPTVLERLTAAGVCVAGVGKVEDLFAGKGLSACQRSRDNADGMRRILEGWSSLESGLLLANLIDFDMVYGHRNDVGGFARALEEFDVWLPDLMAQMEATDLLMITADHGCDPTHPGSDHTREYVPLLAWSPRLEGAIDLGTRATYADVAATLADCFSLTSSGVGASCLAALFGDRLQG